MSKTNLPKVSTGSIFSKTSTTQTVTKPPFLKTKDFQEIQSDKRTESAKPEIHVDPNLYPNKKGHYKSSDSAPHTADSSVTSKISSIYIILILFLSICE